MILDIQLGAHIYKKQVKMATSSGAIVVEMEHGRRIYGGYRRYLLGAQTTISEK